ncbi:crotonobetaine/carnitine-CoA ligase [Klebsiella pneumoniae]|uniref:Crotonobetaine/carnitine-CoA ligase n=1 Tax=Klebsiella pneumoniae TaxID=573 RepID=A0A377XSS7_KLEPN|nr:crotonobetaine/carnitine-CoA ligase [Klebsiella pneumoniae]
MFHVNAWGTPFIAAMVGARLVLPGPHLDGDSLLQLLAAEKVTVGFGRTGDLGRLAGGDAAGQRSGCLNLNVRWSAAPRCRRRWPRPFSVITALR